MLQARGPTRRPRILIVEDEAPNRALLIASLARFGDDLTRSAEIIEAGTLAQAMRALAASEDIDVVVLDVLLPDGSGLEFARTLAKLHPDDRPRVMILTASVMPEEREAALVTGAGVDLFIGKPYRPAEVVEAIGDLLRRRSPAAAR